MFPGSFTAYAIIPGGLIIILALVISGLFIKYYWRSTEHDRICAVIATLAVWISVLTSFLLPVDIFMLSYVKYPNGTYKEWATNGTRTTIDSGLNISYYTMYGIILFFLFFLLPMAYFAHEEQEDYPRQGSRRFCYAFLFTLGFLVCIGLLFLIGAFIPYAQSMERRHPDWKVLNEMIQSLYSNRGTDALYFTMDVMMLIAMVLIIMYTGVGLASYPVSLFRGWRSFSDEKARLQERKDELTIRKSIMGSQLEPGTTRYETESHAVQEEEHLISRMEQELGAGTSWHKFSSLFRFVDISLGFFCVVGGFLIWLGILLSNVDKLTNSLGYKTSYLLLATKITNPLDFIMVASQKVFPLDYIIFFLIIQLLLGVTVGGIRDLGIWCLCVKVYEVRPYKTAPQALILLSVILMFANLGLNILMYSAIPQYVTFGSQRYLDMKNHTFPCSMSAPSNECTMTRASRLIVAFAVKAWFFGAAYYWMTWAFLLAVIFGFTWAIVKKPFSYIEHNVHRDDFDESDEDVRPLVA